MSRSNASAVQRVLSVLALVVCFFLPLAAHAATDTVTNLSDSGAGSLRDAITNATAGDTIVFQGGLTGTITLASTLTIAENLTIQGPGANVITVSGNHAVQIFNTSSGTIAISGLTIANGTAGSGGGISNSGTLTVTGVTFSGNVATGGPATGGGGIFSNGTLTITNSIFAGNSGLEGGGILTSSGTLTVTNSNFAGNSASFAGGGILSQGTATVTNSTFSGNFGGQGGGVNNFSGTMTVSNSTFFGNSGSVGGILNQAATLTVNNSIFSGNSGGAGDSGSGNPLSISNSVFFNNNGSDCTRCTSNTNEITADPKLLPLGSYGGPIQTMMPQPGSSAICAGSNALVPGGVTTDQRGFPLVTTCVDAGAVQTNYALVTNTNDSGSGSLRAAVSTVTTAGIGDIGFTSGATGTITLNSAMLPLTGTMAIIGPGASSLTISGGGSTTVGSVLTVNSGAQVFLYGLTITDGNSEGDDGGGGIDNEGTLTVMASAVTNNSAELGGGGINNFGTLTVTDSTISGNTDNSGNGGGIFSDHVLTVTDSTIYGNTTSSSGANGGGIDVATGTLTLTGSTVTANSAICSPCGGDDARGGGIYGAGTLVLANSIVAGNSVAGPDLIASADIAGIYTDNGGNQASNDPSATSQINIHLAPLGNYGGPTQTTLPLPNSPAICTGLQANIPSGITTDQRGFPNVNTFYFGTACVDVGAVQTDYQAFEFDKTRYNGVPGLAVSPAPVVSVIENGQNIGGIPVTISFNGNGTATGLGPVTTVAGTGATFSNLSVDTKGESDSLSYVVSISPPGFSDAQFTAEATLDITAQPPVVSVAFSPATILPGGTSTTTMTVTVTNPNAIPLTGLSISDALPSRLVFDPGGVVVCGTGFSIMTTSGSISLTGFTLQPNGTCTVSVPLHAATAGVFTDTTSTVPSNEADTGTAGSGTLTVLAPPLLSAAFGAPLIVYGGTTSVTFTLTNPNTTTTLTGVSFSDTLPAGLVFATPNALTNTCGSGLVSAGGGALSTIASITFGPGATCTITVNVTAVAAGTQSDTTSTVASGNGGTGVAATASIMVAPAVLTVTAVSPTILFGTALPAYTASITGFVNSDPTTVVSGTASLTTSPTTPTQVGTYTITASQGTLSATNYAFTFVNGLLTINKAATGVTLMQTAPTTSGVGTGVSTTFTATVNDTTSGSTGTPTRSVQFFDGATLLGSSPLSGGVATFTTTFSTVTTHVITAVYSGDGNFTGSTSAQFSEVVVTPGFSISSNPNSITIAQGGNATATLTLTPVGNYTGAIALNCTGLPAFSSCQFLPPSITFTGNNVAQTVQLTVFTLNAHAAGGASSSGLLWLPAGMLACLVALRRRKFGRAMRPLLMVAIAALVFAGITGCGSSATFVTPTGNNTVTISATGTNGGGVTTQTAVITVTITQ